MTREPVAVINSVITVIEAAIAVAVGFGLDLTPEQVGLLMALVISGSNLVSVLWLRGQVTPVADPRDERGNPLN